MYVSEKLYSQTNAITEFGDNIILYDDGTWEFKEIRSLSETRKNPKLLKNLMPIFLIKSKKANIGIWLNNKKWGFEKQPIMLMQSTNLILKMETFMQWLLLKRLKFL